MKPEEKINQKMWEGRISGPNSRAMEILGHSLDYDKRLYPQDIAGSLAHCNALYESKLLSGEEKEKLQKALKLLEKELDAGATLFKPSDEDIHMAIERVLTERLGPLGKKLHTGRSRNDQIATDFRMWIRGATQKVIEAVTNLQKALLSRAEELKGKIMPGYTHLQQAQPVDIAHYLMSFFFALERDRSRLLHVLESVSLCPLGSGAIAGSSFGYDRKDVAKQLGFDGISENSIDATSHRDFALEFISATSILSSLLSRYAEDWVIWSSREFSFIQLPDSLTTGSSMMPQKKNPDSMELIRGKTGRMLGAFTSLFTTIKGAPLCYSRDLQEDKEPVFEAYDTIFICLTVMCEAVEGVQFRFSEINSRMDDGMLATDLADILATEGMPFRDAHHVVGNLSAEAEKQNCGILSLSDNYWKKVPNGKKIKEKLTFENSLDRRNIQGGTGPGSVDRQIKLAKKILNRSS